ncbi:polysaccharide biosynthesis/export family protein [Phormidium tenue FACHB-886]|nr:polysaccharide biosynthesis/export family protein [Phormidium tenue FACHB-886]
MMGLAVVAIASAATIVPSVAQTAPARTPATTPTPSMPLQDAEIVPSTPSSATPIPEPALSPNPIPTRGAVVAPPGVLPQEDTYVLGPGDQIGIDIFDVPEFSGDAGRYTVLIDGSINLPWVGRVLVQGLTLEQAADVLTQAYAPFIRNPIITVNLGTARTLRVSVVGEVKRPGSYIISPAGETNVVLVGTPDAAGAGAASQWPSVTQALQAAGGITQLANLRQVQLRRALPDGSEQVIDVNLWELLRSGELSQDVALRDRDTLVIPRAETLSSDEALLNGSASFAPEIIRVNVVGEVVAPGIVEVPPNTSLNQALMAAGGFDSRRARRSRVELVRLNTDGTAVKRTVPVDMAAGINEQNNPALRDGDTIMVGRSSITGVRDFVDDVFGPFDGIFGRILDIFD